MRRIAIVWSCVHEGRREMWAVEGLSFSAPHHRYDVHLLLQFQLAGTNCTDPIMVYVSAVHIVGYVVLLIRETGCLSHLEYTWTDIVYLTNI